MEGAESTHGLGTAPGVAGGSRNPAGCSRRGPILETPGEGHRHHHTDAPTTSWACAGPGRPVWSTWCSAWASIGHTAEQVTASGGGSQAARCPPASPDRRTKVISVTAATDTSITLAGNGAFHGCQQRCVYGCQQRSAPHVPATVRTTPACDRACAPQLPAMVRTALASDCALTLAGEGAHHAADDGA